MWFISNRCYGPTILCRKTASLSLQPHDIAQQAEGQSSNSCMGESLPTWGLTAVFLNKQKQMREKKMMSCTVNIAAQTIWTDDVAVLSHALSPLKHRVHHRAGHIGAFSYDKVVWMSDVSNWYPLLCWWLVGFAVQRYGDPKSKSVSDVDNWIVTWLNWISQIS